MSNVNIDDTSVQNLFNALDADSTKQILFTALKKGGQKLTSQTKRSLRAKLGAGATTPNRWNGKTMESGVRLKADKDYCEVSVSILGDFRLKFFEKGTAQRRLRRGGANRGSIKPLNFFREARQQDIDETINSSITESLRRINQ